jgi:hypothetical protein
MAFLPECITVALGNILPLKKLTLTLRGTPKYKQIAASIQEIGLVEPLVIHPAKDTPGKYLLLDGHLRYGVLKELGVAEVRCLVSTDDEGFTYNKRVNRLATIQEHFMILKAVDNGVSEERIAKVLNVNVANIRQRLNMLDGICAEAIETLKSRHVTPEVFKSLRKMKPARQSEVAELMVAANNFSVMYAYALLMATNANDLIRPPKDKAKRGLSPEQVARMETEMESLQRQIKQLDDSYGQEYLALMMARGYLVGLLGNGRVARFLNQRHADVLKELQAVVDDVTAESRSAEVQARGASPT